MNHHREKILVLDSDAHFLTSLEHCLENEGFDTTVTWNMWEAIALLATRKFDLVLVGAHPPEVSAVNVLRRLRALHTPAPCIILHERDRHPFEAQHFCALGAYAVIPRGKPKLVVEGARRLLRRSRAILPSDWQMAAD